MLPPLTFYEFLCFIGKDDELIVAHGKSFATDDIKALNEQFVDYLNFGGYPESVLNPEIRSNPDQFIRNDIIEKVLLKDLPSLYGISEIQELNKLFSFLAYNAGNEASLDKIAQGSGLAKPTIKKYIEYLESAFLVMKVKTVDDNCRTLKRERNFKIYLNNPSMRAALFAPVDYSDSANIGHLAECAVFSQWQHSPSFSRLRYARWRNEGEVDVVYLGASNEKPTWIGEVKWSDRIQSNPSKEMRSVVAIIKRHKSIKAAFFTTKAFTVKLPIEDIVVNVMPTALYCYMVGRNITSRLDASVVTGEAQEPPEDPDEPEPEEPEEME
jgi:predicted AAA+ superfamily ATPase